MSLNAKTKLLAGAALIVISGTALANTNLDGSTTGDLFLNIVNTTNDTSFVFDTGVSQASFVGTMSYSYNLATDPNYVSFTSAGGTFDYSVVSATNTGATNPTKDNVFFTGTVIPPAGDVAHANQAQAQTIISQFTGLANTVTSTTGNSAVLGPSAVTGTNLYWGAPGVEGAIAAQLLGNGTAPYVDGAAPGSVLQFYSENGGTLTTYTGTWDLSGAVLTYTASGGSGTPPPPPAVPLPAPVLLLLSGLGLMGAIARRNKPAQA